jgi:DNA-binding beta-propeller fold protein YncE
MSGPGLVIFGPAGKQIGIIQPIQSPFADGYAHAGRFSPDEIFTSDDSGDIIGFSFGVYGTGKLSQVASGFAHNGKTGWAVLGASGIQDDSKKNALYIVDGVDNTVVEFTDATGLGQANEIIVEKGGKKFDCRYKPMCAKLIYSGPPLDAPEAAAILPNGNLIIANTAGGNTLVELTPAGKVLDTKVVDKSKTQGIFGLVARGSNDNDTVLFFSDRNGNNVQELKR